jgi:hypothetical protein
MGEMNHYYLIFKILKLCWSILALFVGGVFLDVYLCANNF